MPVRRLNRPFTVVLTGVENAQKTTIGRMLSHRNGWPMMEEAARTDAAVLTGKTTLDDLQRLQDEFISQVERDLAANASPVLIYDTGGLVLDMWARKVFGEGLQRTDKAMGLMDLHLFFHTMHDWHPDPLRTLPRIDDRLALQERYRIQLNSSDCRFEEILMAPRAKRLEHAEQLIAQYNPG